MIKRIDEGVGADELGLQCIPHARRSEAKKKKKPSTIWKEKAKSIMKSKSKKEKLKKNATEDKAKEDEKDELGMFTGKQVRVISEHAGRASYGQ